MNHRIEETEWTAEKRVQYHQEHPENFAGGRENPISFPIADEEDVKHAAQLYGHSDNPQATKHHIISVAHRLGLTHALPESWQEDSPVDPDAPLAALYNPTPAEQLAAILSPYPEDKHGWEKPQGTWSEQSPMMNLNDQSGYCHAERSEASLGPLSETLRCAQGDNTLPVLMDDIHHCESSEGNGHGG
jgi:hypothetical protein